MTKAIYFDMDGTFVDLYGVPNWLPSLIAEQTRPYREAKALIPMRQFTQLVNELQRMGYHVGIVSWLSKSGTEDYNARVTTTKENWLATHCPNIMWDEISIVPYGTPKQTVVQFPEGILFDDEARNRDNWTGRAYDVDDILWTLKRILVSAGFGEIGA